MKSLIFVLSMNVLAIGFIVTGFGMLARDGHMFIAYGLAVSVMWCGWFVFGPIFHKNELSNEKYKRELNERWNDEKQNKSN